MSKKSVPISPSFAGKWNATIVAHKMGLDVDQAQAIIDACAQHDRLIEGVSDVLYRLQGAPCACEDGIECDFCGARKALKGALKK